MPGTSRTQEIAHPGRDGMSWHLLQELLLGVAAASFTGRASGAPGFASHCVHFSFSVSQCLIRLPQAPGEVGHTVVIGPQSAQAKVLLFAAPHPWEIPDLVLCDEAADVDPEKLADLLPRPDVWVTGRKPTAIGEKHAAIGRERRARLEGGPDWEEQDEQIEEDELDADQEERELTSRASSVAIRKRPASVASNRKRTGKARPVSPDGCNEGGSAAIPGEAPQVGGYSVWGGLIEYDEDCQLGIASVQGHQNQKNMLQVRVLRAPAGTSREFTKYY